MQGSGAAYWEGSPNLTVAAAFPAAAQRLVRSAAASRALRLGLFVGALFALGLLFGGPAQAAVATPELPDTVTSTTETGPESHAETVPEPTEDEPSTQHLTPAPESDPSEPTAEALNSTAHTAPGTAPARPRGTVARTTADTANAASVLNRANESRPTRRTATDPELTGPQAPLDRAGYLVRSAAGELTHAVTAVVGELAEDAAWALPEPRFPWPTLPGFDIPGPGGGDSGGARPGAPAPSVPQDRGHGARAGADAYEMRRDAGYAQWDRCVATHTGRGAHASLGRYAEPRPQSPSEAPHRPYGIASQSASDGGSQRHDELPAATSADGPSFRLVSGAGTAAAYCPTRDRNRDILELPG